MLDAPEARAFALKSLDRVLREAWGGREGRTQRPGARGGVWRAGRRAAEATVAGVLDDYVFLGHAALDAWEATGELRYYEAAVELMESALRRFYDPAGGAFFDTEKPAEGERRLGALVTRRKPLQDSPTPAGNPMAAMLLMRLSELNGRLDYAEKAQETLETFAGVVEHFGLYAATYALALQRLVREPVQVCVIGEDADARALEAAALRRYAVNKSVVRLGAACRRGRCRRCWRRRCRACRRSKAASRWCAAGTPASLQCTSPEELAAVLVRSREAAS